MKKFLGILVLGLLWCTASLADNFIQKKFGGYYCKIRPEAPYCVKKKHQREAFKYCDKIYPLTREDLDTNSKQSENYFKCTCEYMNQKGHEQDCRPLIERIRDITKKK